MSIRVDPTIPNPAPPTVAVSPDGIVTATVDSARAGVLLRADFSTFTPMSETFDSDHDGWVAHGPATLSQSSGRLRATWTQAQQSVGVDWTLPTPIAPETQIRISFTIPATSGFTADRLRVVLASGAWAYSPDQVTPPASGRSYSVDMTVLPSDVDLSHIKIYVTGPTTTAGWFEIDNVTVSQVTLWPNRVRFLRDGVPILSGNPAWAPEGRATAYDYFGPLGESSVYTAVPLYADGTVGQASQGVGVTTPDLDCALGDCWLKSVANPNLSIRVSLRAPNPFVGTVARFTPTDILGAEYPSVAWSTRGHVPVGLNIRTSTYDEYAHLEAVLDSGPVLVQTMRAYGIPQFFGIASDTQADYLTMPTDPRRNVTVTFQPVNPPSSIDSPLYIPGRSWAEVGAQWTWDELGDIFTWDSLLVPA